MLNLNYILLLFCKPFLDRKPERVKSIEKSYCVYSKLINFDKEAKLFDYQNHIDLDVDQSVKDGNFGYFEYIYIFFKFFFISNLCLYFKWKMNRINKN